MARSAGEPQGGHIGDYRRALKSKRTSIFIVRPEEGALIAWCAQALLNHKNDSLSVAKSQFFLPANVRRSSRVARCAGVISCLARIFSIPSLIPRNAPSTATPFSEFQPNTTLPSCLPIIRFLKSIIFWFADCTVGRSINPCQRHSAQLGRKFQCVGHAGLTASLQPS
jgi:hypothetical protein